MAETIGINRKDKKQGYYTPRGLRKVPERCPEALMEITEFYLHDGAICDGDGLLSSLQLFSKFTCY